MIPTVELIDITAKVLKTEEGFSSKPYICSEGYPTIGYGERIGNKYASLADFNTRTTTKMEAKVFLKTRLEYLEKNLSELEWFSDLDTDRKVIVLSMAYQLGYNGLLRFVNMISALDFGDYHGAAVEALDSNWRKQTPARAIRHADVLENGNLLRQSKYKAVLV